MRHLDRWPLVIIALAAIADAVILSNAPLVLRAPAVLAFLLLCPGLAFVRFLRVRSLPVELVLAVALSLAIDTLVAEGLVLARAWSAGVALALLIFVSIVGAVLQLLVSGVAMRRAPEE